MTPLPPWAVAVFAVGSALVVFVIALCAALNL